MGARRALDEHEVVLSKLRLLARENWCDTATALTRELGLGHSAAGIGKLLRIPVGPTPPGGRN